MSQIILIENNDTLRDLLKFNIMKCLGINVIEKKNAFEAVSLLEIVPNIDMVICRENIESEKTGIKLARYLEKEKSSIPLLVIGNNVSAYPHLSAIDINQCWKSIIAKISKILNIDASMDEAKSINEFVPVSLNYFLNISSASMGCDVYIRLKKGNEYQYIKRLRSCDQFTRADIEKYQAAGLREFYILKEYYNSFINFASSHLSVKLENSSLTCIDRIQLGSEAYNLTSERIHSLGVDQHTVEIVESSIKSMMSSVREDDALASFLKSLRAKKLSYGYVHSYLGCLVLHKIFPSFEMKYLHDKDFFTFVSYFHDISLRDDLVGYHSTTDVINSGLAKGDKLLIQNHAMISAAIVESFENIPSGVVEIIREHHGSKNGVGFSELLSDSISPVSMVFIVVEDFVDEYLKIIDNPTISNVNRVLEVLGKKYNKHTYEETVMALKNMITKRSGSR